MALGVGSAATRSAIALARARSSWFAKAAAFPAPTSGSPRRAVKASLAPRLLKVPASTSQLASKRAFSAAGFASPVQSPFFFVHFAESFVPLRVARSLPGTSGQPLAIVALPSPPTTIESGSDAAEPGTSGSAGVSTTKLPLSQAGRLRGLRARGSEGRVPGRRRRARDSVGGARAALLTPEHMPPDPERI